MSTTTTFQHVKNSCEKPLLSIVVNRHKTAVAGMAGTSWFDLINTHDVKPSEIIICFRYVVKTQWPNFRCKSMTSKLIFFPSEDRIILLEVQINSSLNDLSYISWKFIIIIKDNIGKILGILKVGISGGILLVIIRTRDL